MVRSTGAVAGFIPRTANVSLSWRYRNFGSRVVANRTGSYVRNYTAIGSGANLYTRERTIVNAGIAYQYKPALGFSVDLPRRHDGDVRGERTVLEAVMHFWEMPAR